VDGELKVAGGCKCGAIRYEALGAPIEVTYCHCSDCRGYTGAPVVTWVAFDAQNVQFLKGERKMFESSPGISWGFCGNCGTSLSLDGISKRYSGMHTTEFHISTLDNPEKFVPDRHMHDGERLPWFEVADNLPRYYKLDDGIEPTHYGPKNRQ